MRDHEDGTNQQRDHNVERGVRQEQESDGEERQNQENDPIFNHAADENQRLVAEEVEEEP